MQRDQQEAVGERGNVIMQRWVVWGPEGWANDDCLAVPAALLDAYQQQLSINRQRLCDICGTGSAHRGLHAMHVCACYLVALALLINSSMTSLVASTLVLRYVWFD